MEPKLPQGLVAMPKMSPSEDLKQDILSTGVYKNLWQAYSTSHLASKDETERRLEHLFWRIWGVKQLSSRMNTHTLDRLILRIKAPVELVGQEMIMPRSMPEKGNKEAQPINKTKSSCVTETCSLHPILKKPQSSSAESNKTTRLLLDTSNGTKITLEPSYSPTSTMPAEPTPMPDPTGHHNPKKTSIIPKPTAIPDIPNRQSTKKTHLTANRNGRIPRRRPIFNRRRSWQATISKTPSPARRRSEPTTQTDNPKTSYEDSYVELGLLQHLSFREEEDQIARDLGREIAPEPKPTKPPVPLFDEDFCDEPATMQGPKTGAGTSPVPFPRASSLRRPMLSPEDFCKITPSFGVQSHVELPGGPQLVTTDDVEGDWTDVDAIDSALPVSRHSKGLVVHERAVEQTPPTVQSTITPVAKQASLLSSGMKGLRL